MSPQTANIPDHDTIIALKTGFDIFTKQYTIDMAELKNVTTTKMSELKTMVTAEILDHDQRIRAMETMVEQLQPVKTVAEFRVLQKKVTDWETTANTWRVIAGVIGGLITFVFTQLPSVLKQWGVIH